MKRTPLQRRTRLVTRTPLVAHKPLQRGTLILRRTPLAPFSAKRRADNGIRRQVVSAMRLAASGRCARCGRRDLPVRGHERLARAHGGDILRPDCLLCDFCNGAIEDSPRVSCWNGWKVSPKWPHDPALRPWEARDLDGRIVDFTVLMEDIA